METRGERWHREAERHTVRDGLAAAAMAALAYAVFTVSGYAVCFSLDRGPDAEDTTPAMEVHDIPAPVDAERVDPPSQDLTEEQIGDIYGETMREWHADDPEDIWYQEDADPEEYHVEEYAQEYDGGLTMSGGVNWYDGRMETYYSSNVLPHYRLDEWTLDEEGFYRTDEGYYVVAASDMEQGTVFQGSKGECIVLDCGCDAGVTDYYTAW